MHIDGTDQVTVSRKPARFARPLPVSRLVFMPTHWTLATCSSFRASEALDVGLFGFVGQIIEILSVFPQAHTLIVMASVVGVADPMGIANKEGAHLLINTEVDHFPAGLMALVTNTPLGSSRLLVFGPLQLLPATRAFVTAGLLFADGAQGFAAPSFERANPASGHNEGLTGIGGDAGEMNLSQIDRGVDRAWSVFGLWNLDAHMQFIAMVPHQRHRPALFR